MLEQERQQRIEEEETTEVVQEAEKGRWETAMTQESKAREVEFLVTRDRKNRYWKEPRPRCQIRRRIVLD